MAETETEVALDDAPRKILVVDDEPDLELLVSQKFRHQIRKGDLIFSFARDGLDALNQLGQDPDIRLVLSDINMPQMDGLALLEQIGQLNHEICAVMISAYGDMENIRTAMNRGAFDFITKPINFEDLETTINKTLNHLSLMANALAARDQLVELRRDLNLASEMQKSILTNVFPSKDNYNVYATMETAREVGGDFYDVFHLTEGRIGFVMADVSGKGVPAALFMMVCRTMMKAAAIGHHAPSAVLREVNDLVLEKNEAEMFVTVFYGIYDPESRVLRYANAGHNNPLLVRSGGQTEFLPSTRGIAIGVVEDLDFAEGQVSLEPGDAVFLYTDGVTEAANSEDEEFGEERLVKTLSSAAREDATTTTQCVLDAVHEFAAGVRQADDITCLTLFCRDGATPTVNQTVADRGAASSAGDVFGNGSQSGSGQQFDFCFKNDINEISRIEEKLTGFLTENGISPRACLQIQLAVEETVTNVISYSYDDNEEHEIKIAGIFDNGSLTIDIVDDGEPYDPLAQATKPDIGLSLEERKLGGLGVHLIREMMDAVSYKRADGNNCLTLTKKID